MRGRVGVGGGIVMKDGEVDRVSRVEVVFERGGGVIGRRFISGVKKNRELEVELVLVLRFW